MFEVLLASRCKRPGLPTRQVPSTKFQASHRHAPCREGSQTVKRFSDWWATMKGLNSELPASAHGTALSGQGGWRYRCSASAGWNRPLANATHLMTLRVRVLDLNIISALCIKDCSACARLSWAMIPNGIDPSTTLLHVTASLGGCNSNRSSLFK